MKYEISNIKILQKLSVVREILHNTNIVSIAEAKALIDHLCNADTIVFNSENNEDMIVLSVLEECQSVFFEKKTIDDNPPINKSIIGESGNIFNPCGLTQAENWYNDLSNEEKINVKHLTSLFYHPACG